MGLISRFLMAFKIKANAALDRAEDPRELVEYAYTQQQELLRKTKQGLIAVATSKVRLEQQANRLRAQTPKIEMQAERALGHGREDLARLALQRKQTVLAELEQLDFQAAEVAQEERRLTKIEQELAARVEQFRTRRDAISARYTAAQAQVRVQEALAGVSGEFAELGMALGRAAEKTERMEARAAAIGSLFEAGTLALPPHGTTDPVAGDLQKLEADQTVEEELAALKANMDAGDTSPALGAGPDREDADPRGKEV